MHRSPRLGSTSGNGKSWWKNIEFLKGVLDSGSSFNAVADSLLELPLDVLADDEDGVAKPGAQGVVDRIIDDGLATRTDRINLLEGAIAVARAGGQNEQAGDVISSNRLADGLSRNYIQRAHFERGEVELVGLSSTKRNSAGHYQAG